MKPQAPARLAAGAQVRVKLGTTDPDFADIPLGGWAGTIREVDQTPPGPPTYLIEWNRHTLEHMHPVYRNRCERDGLEAESMWLGEEDIEPDTGEAPLMEQPAEIRVRPLNEKDQEDRIRAAFGLTSDDLLPDVDQESLAKFHAYLVGRLSFPFPAEFTEETGPLQEESYPATVVGLLDADDCDDMYGLLCEARQGKEKLELPLAEIEAKKGSPNRRLIGDYSFWFWNWR